MPLTDSLVFVVDIQLPKTILNNITNLDEYIRETLVHRATGELTNSVRSTHSVEQTNWSLIMVGKHIDCITTIAKARIWPYQSRVGSLLIKWMHKSRKENRMPQIFSSRQEYEAEILNSSAKSGIKKYRY